MNGNDLIRKRNRLFAMKEQIFAEHLQAKKIATVKLGEYLEMNIEIEICDGIIEEWNRTAQPEEMAL